MARDSNFYNAFDEESLELRKADPYRTPFQMDRDRIIHSFAFRRLQSKTQVFRPGEYDFYRTRLTHTIEVSQIGRAICVFLSKTSSDFNRDYCVDADLVEAICLAHDIGHPPFGHAGERALNALMKNFGGFEANAQTVRLLTETIWSRPSEAKRIGMNPSRALLDGVMKYKRLRSNASQPKQFLYDEQAQYVGFVHGSEASDIVDEPRSIECQIMDWADDVAYCVADFVDGVLARFITFDKLRGWKGTKRYEPLMEEIFVSLEKKEITHFGARKIGEFIQACAIEKSDEQKTLATVTNRYKYKLDQDEEMKRQKECLKQIACELVFMSPGVQQLEDKARRMLTHLFHLLMRNYMSSSNPSTHLLPPDVEAVLASTGSHEVSARRLCDYISGMSDDYAIRTYRRFFEPVFGSIVDLV